MKKTISIIGGGIAGLTAGIYAQQNNFDTVIYEKHSVAGGLCSYWTRQGYTIDNCLHWLTGTNPNTELHELWKNTGVLADDVEVLQLESFMQVELNGEKLVLWRDVERLRQDMLRLSPEDKKEIDSLIKYINIFSQTVFPCRKPRELMNIFDFASLIWKMRKIGKPFREFSKLSLYDYSKRFKHPLIRKFLTSYFPKFYNVACQLWVFGMFTTGNADLPRGGSKGMIERMVARYLELGGKIRYSMPAERINLNSSKAESVTFKNGETIVSDYVITACDLHFVITQLIPQIEWDSYMIDHYKTNTDLYPTHSSFNVYFGVDFFTQAIERPTLITPTGLVINRKPIDELIVKDFNYEPNFAPEGKTILQVLVNQYDDDGDYWCRLRESNREEYKAEKMRIAAVIQENIESSFPEMKGHLTLLDVPTPATNLRYTNSIRGAYMGFGMTPYNKKITHNGRVRGVDNLYLAGQFLAAPGGTPNAVASGKFAVDRIVHDLKKKK